MSAGTGGFQKKGKRENEPAVRRGSRVRGWEMVLKQEFAVAPKRYL